MCTRHKSSFVPSLVTFRALKIRAHECRPSGRIRKTENLWRALSSLPASADSRCIVQFFVFLNIRHVEPTSCFWIKTLGQVVNTNALCTIDPALPQSLFGPNIESVFPPNLATFGLAVLWIIHSFHHFMQAPQNLHYAK